MTVFVALLRGVNVGGSGVLPMRQLQSLCTDLGLEKVRTYIQSGNVVFVTRLGERTVVTRLAQSLAEHMGRDVAVMVRTDAELRATLKANPFPDAKPAQVGVVFLSEPVPQALLSELRAPDGEELHAIRREVFIHYPIGMGRSKLRLPAAVANGTTRNLNTVAKLLSMAEAT